MYAITKVEPVGRLAEAVYGVWAKYRMEVTGREPLAVILDKRRKSEEEMTCRGSGADAAACEAPPPPAAGKQ